MPTEPDLRKEIADERRALADAVASLREEIGQAAKKAGTTAGAVTGAALAARTLLRLRRRRR